VLEALVAAAVYAAKFNPDGSGEWLPLVHGGEKLTAASGFNDQGDVVIEARRAAELLGATPMDRPEDIEPNPTTGKVYVNLTNNSRRQQNLDKPGQPGREPANPRAKNEWGEHCRDHQRGRRPRRHPV
jgi:uncharacterized protein